MQRELEGLSKFNRAVVEALIPLAVRVLGSAMSVEQKAKAVTLTVKMAGRPVTFANMRSAKNMSADIRLYGYMPDNTSLKENFTADLQDEGRNGWFYKGKAEPEDVAQMLVRHAQDVMQRVEAYAASNPVPKGAKPRRTWAAQGIPFSYFK